MLAAYPETIRLLCNDVSGKRWPAYAPSKNFGHEEKIAGPSQTWQLNMTKIPVRPATLCKALQML